MFQTKKFQLIISYTIRIKEENKCENDFVIIYFLHHNYENYIVSKRKFDNHHKTANFLVFLFVFILLSNIFYANLAGTQLNLILPSNQFMVNVERRMSK